MEEIAFCWSSRAVKFQHLVTHLNIYSGIQSCWCLLAVVVQLYLSKLVFPELSPLGSDVLSMWCCWLVGHLVGESKLEEIPLIFLAIFKSSTEFHTFRSLFTWQERALQNNTADFGWLQPVAGVPLDSCPEDPPDLPRGVAEAWLPHMPLGCLVCFTLTVSTSHSLQWNTNVLGLNTVWNFSLSVS